ncbi:MAG: hypothetical protein K8R77_16795 [Anaerolineaceae bacterium]|nr:hypothetical protein [Anaerolineaceae bacterium]
MTKDDHTPDTWVRLLDAQGGIREDAIKPPRPQGRPRNPFPKHSVHITLTSNEITVLDKLIEQLSIGTNTKVSRGQIIAFMAHYLRDELSHLEIELAETKSFRELAEKLRKEIE